MKKINKTIIYNALIVVSFSVSSCYKNSSNEKTVLNNNSVKINSVVRSPFHGVNVSYEKLSIEPGRDTIITLASGSRITLKATTLIDSAGSPITESSHLKFREFMDPADIMAAGIPMMYKDSVAGLKVPFQSAGMFELLAENNGNKKIYINPEFPVKVELASNNRKEGYSNFYLNSSTGQWVYSGEEMKKNNEIKLEINKQLKKLKAVSAFLGKDYFALNSEALLDIYLNDNYEKISVYFDNPNKPLPKGLLKYGIKAINVISYDAVKLNRLEVPASMVIWENTQKVVFPDWTRNKRASIKHEGGNNYELTISNGKKKETVFKAHVKAVMTIKSLFRFEPEMWNQNYEMAFAEVKKQEEALATMKDVYRILEINTFGIYNCDKFYNNSEKFIVKANFKLPLNGSGFEPEKFYYVSIRDKISVEYKMGEQVALTLFNDPSAALYTVLEGNVMAVVNSGELNKFSSEMTINKTVLLEFKPKAKVNSIQDIKKCIGI